MRVLLSIEEHCQHLNKHIKGIYSQTRSASAIRQTRSGSLSIPMRRQLDKVMITIYEHTASMMEALLRAANSQFIDPAFMNKLAAVNDNLEAVAGQVKMYRDLNKEHGTA